MERLHTTSELVYTFLLDLKIPLSQNAVSLYRTALLNSRAEVIETFRKAIRQLLFENGPSKPEPTREHLNSILGLWMSLSRR